MEDQPFRDLIRRVRAGDPRAAEEVVRCYEPTIRLVVRRRLTDPALRRLFDSMDVCQSVLASFFVRAASGQYDLDTPEQLLKLLTVMARNKVKNHALHQRAARRDYHRVQQGGLDDKDCVAPGASPSQVVANRELLDAFRSRLSDEERRLADQRALGRPWTEIAAEVGGSPDGLRMRLHRAIERVTQELGLEEG
jgi:RNA polymerase sigma-70 factor (ECF subfamily)